MLTDNQYDIIRDYVLDKYPSNKIANQQHKSIKVEHAKVKLPYTMMSMDKIKPDTNSLKQFKKTYKGPYVVSCKLDGISALYSTETGTPKMYTRGNGYIGQTIDHLIDYFNLPKTENITLRGEIIIEENKFINNWSSKYANSRNFIAGIVNNREINEERAKMLDDIDFVVYEVISPPMLKPSKQFDYLTTLQPLPNIVNYKILKQDKLTNEVLSQLLLDWRQEYKYNIDGIIVSNDDVYERKDKNPEHAFAFKMVLSEQEAESRVIDILWTASKDGLLKPRIKIEPVVIGGTTINYATGFNAKFIVDNKIGVGAVVKIIRSGDVIPYIKEITTPADIPLMPQEQYKWNSTNVDILLLNPEQDKTVSIKLITKFFKTIEVEGLGESNIKRIIDSGLNTIPLILSADKSDFLKVENFKDKMATRIYTSIQSRLSTLTLPNLAAATNIFGRGFGEKRIETIITAIPDIFNNNQTTDNDMLINKVKSIDGIGTITAKQFVENIPTFIEFIKTAKLDNLLNNSKNSKTISSEKKDTQQQQQPLKDKIIVLTGFRDKLFTKQLETMGAKIQASVTKKTTLVIAKDVNDVSGKIADAVSKNIKIITLQQFKKEYNI